MDIDALLYELDDAELYLLRHRLGPRNPLARAAREVGLTRQRDAPAEAVAPEDMPQVTFH